MNTDVMNMDIRYLGDMQKIKLEEGDVLVLMCARPLSMDDVEMMRREMDLAFPGNKFVVLGEGMKLGSVKAG